jgi:hypothetical protein
MYPFHTRKLSLPDIRCNIILPRKPRSSEWSRPFRLSNQFSFPMRAACPAHIIVPDFSSVQFFIINVLHQQPEGQLQIQHKGRQYRNITK